MNHTLPAPAQDTNDFEATVYPNADEATRLLMREQRDLIRLFLSSDLGKSAVNSRTRCARRSNVIPVGSDCQPHLLS